MAANELCGLDDDGRGTYTAEGITKLCEGLKESSVTSLKCAAAPRVFAFVSAPADKKANTLPAHVCTSLSPSFHLWHYPSFHLWQ